MKLLTHTPTLLAGLFALGLMNIGAAHAAEQQHSYSNSGYCQLAAKGNSAYQRNLLAAYAGYLGHMWELYALWAWMPAAAAASFAARMDRAAAEGLATWVTFAAIGLGAVSAMLFAGRLISLYGGRRVLSLFSLALIPVLPMVVFSPNLWVLALFMAVFGAMAGCMDVAMNANGACGGKDGHPLCAKHR